jgi:Holliday junction resolvase-like predicted endonuclease
MATTAVATYLRGQGFKIVEQNWRTRWCEIDVISRKATTVYFTEVKHRTSNAQGSGFEYIGPKKMRQLSFAVDFWTASNNWSGDCRLMVAEVSGLNYENISLVEID